MSLLKQSEEQAAHPVQEALPQHLDALRMALEVIAVGDSANPLATASDALRETGFWAELPTANSVYLAQSSGESVLSALPDRLFAVELKTVAVVVASSEKEAFAVARNEQRDACNDVDMDMAALGPVRTIADLIAHGWDERCLPYGGDGNTRCGELLPAPPVGADNVSPIPNKHEPLIPESGAQE